MIKRCLASLGFIIALLLTGGCTKSNSPSASDSDSTAKPAAQAVNRNPTVTSAAKLHWLGKKRLSRESNATNFMDIWNMSESAKLEAQTLDKLATAPWRLLNTPTPLSNAPVASLRSLLNDLVQEESYLEVEGETNRPGEFVFAIRLDAERALFWQTNLATVLESVTGRHGDHSFVSQSPRFTLQLPRGTRSDESGAVVNLTLTRSGEWTLLGVAMGATNAEIGEFIDRIERDGHPFPTHAGNYWIDAGFDLARLNKAFVLGWELAAQIPQVTLTVRGEGSAVRTLANFEFSSPAPVEIEPWNIPTNLVHDPLVGFMAVRGFRPLLKLLKSWDESRFGGPPNQVFFWAQAGDAPLHFFAAPSGQANNQLRQLFEFLRADVNPLFATSLPSNGIPFGSFERGSDSERIRWRGVPVVSPNFDSSDAGGNPFITGGLFPNLVTNRPAPAELIRQFQTDTNLMFYDWEITQPNAYRLIQVSQVARLVFGRARLSMTNNAALPWLVAISPKLGNSGSSARLTGPRDFAFSRLSTIGFTGTELHLLCEWLESPNFPKGFFSTDSKPVPPIRKLQTADPDAR